MKILTLCEVIKLWEANNDTMQIAAFFGVPEAKIANMMNRVLEYKRMKRQGFAV